MRPRQFGFTFFMSSDMTALTRDVWKRLREWKMMRGISRQRILRRGLDIRYVGDVVLVDLFRYSRKQIESVCWEARRFTNLRVRSGHVHSYRYCKPKVEDLYQAWRDENKQSWRCISSMKTCQQKRDGKIFKKKKKQPTWRLTDRSESWSAIEKWHLLNEARDRHFHLPWPPFRICRGLRFKSWDWWWEGRD